MQLVCRLEEQETAPTPLVINYHVEDSGGEEKTRPETQIQEPVESLVEYDRSTCYKHCQSGRSCPLSSTRWQIQMSATGKYTIYNRSTSDRGCSARVCPAAK